ncbi:Mis12 protein-domain-containing protein [Dipodascopsis uninucleata]
MPPVSQQTSSSTALLTEHFEYPPIALIDDIINAVNNILYKCTAAIETFLQTQAPCPDIPIDEIEVGTAKLETLLEGAVDKNFDRFELYVLRNVLAVPDDVADGWMRLEHHKNIDFSASDDHLDSRILNLRKTLQAASHVNEKLCLHRRRNQEILTILKTYNAALEFLQHTHGVSPIDETVRFLVSQTAEIQHKVNAIRNLEIDSLSLLSADNPITINESMKLSERQLYIEKMTALIVGKHDETDSVDLDREFKTDPNVEASRAMVDLIKRWSPNACAVTSSS